MHATQAMTRSGSRLGRWLARLAAAAVLSAGSFAGVALAEPDLTRTVGKWIVACEKTEAGGRQCEVRNDEGGLPALEQSRLLSFTLNSGSNEADGLVRIADLELAPPPRRRDRVRRPEARGRGRRPARPPRGALCLAEIGAPGPRQRRCHPGSLPRPAGQGPRGHLPDHRPRQGARLRKRSPVAAVPLQASRHIGQFLPILLTARAGRG